MLKLSLRKVATNSCFNFGCERACLCLLSRLPEVIATDKEDVAFKDLDVAILVGSMPRREGMERKDLLKANVKIFKSQGAALDKYAKKTVKVSVTQRWLFFN